LFFERLIPEVAHLKCLTFRLGDRCTGFVQHILMRFIISSQPID
jgi:hypothetical protein